jgi:hypothetical protein
MTTVKIEGWEPGFIAVRFNRFLRDRTQLGLADAKFQIDSLLHNVPFSLCFSERRIAEAFVVDARLLHVRCSILE